MGERKESLRDKMFAAMGEFPAKPCGSNHYYDTLKRDGYRIEKIVLQTRPNVWVDPLPPYVPDVKERVPAVLVVHGHWLWARRDPVVQARCLGLVKLGFFVLAIDAFGPRERYTKPARAGLSLSALQFDALARRQPAWDAGLRQPPGCRLSAEPPDATASGHHLRERRRQPEHVRRGSMNGSTPLSPSARSAITRRI